MPPVVPKQPTYTPPTTGGYLLLQAQRGVEGAFDKLFEGMCSPMRQYLYYFTGSAETADMLVRATRLVALGQVPDISEYHINTTVWLMGIARELLCDHLDTAEPTLKIAGDEQQQTVLATIASLTPRKQEQMVLRLICGFDTAVAGAITAPDA